MPSLEINTEVQTTGDVDVDDDDDHKEGTKG